jgi:hypothetical protein
VSTLAHLVARLEDAHADLVSVRPAVEAGDPWRLAGAYGVEDEAAWGPRELLAHVAEMLPYWFGEIERVLAGGPEPVPFGRIASDKARIEAIGRDRTLTIRDLFARIANGVADYADLLDSLTPGDTERRGAHPTLGEMTIERIIERFVVNHAEEHARQLESILEAARVGRPA